MGPLELIDLFLHLPAPCGCLRYLRKPQMSWDTCICKTDLNPCYVGG